jgi:hypothetical protein
LNPTHIEPKANPVMFGRLASKAVLGREVAVVPMVERANAGFPMSWLARPRLRSESHAQTPGFLETVQIVD